MAAARGKLVSIEGIDAAGKTTQAALLRQALGKCGISVHIYHFPDVSTAIGGLLRKVLTGEMTVPLHALFSLFCANRLESKASIQSSKSFVDVVVLDRYSESEYAYGAAHGLPSAWLRCLESQMPAADLVVILDIDVREAAERLKNARGADRVDTFEKNLDLLDRARVAYLSLAVNPPVPGQRWEVVDASPGVQVVHSVVLAHVTSLLGKPTATSP